MAERAAELWVWMNGERVGAWQRRRTGAHRFIYETAWLASSRVRPLSMSMPLTADRTVSGALVENYFDNLLPDDERIRRRIGMRFGTDSTAAFELLQAIGRDCVGAVQLLPPGMAPDGFDRLSYSPMTDADVERHLQGVVAEPGPGHPDDDGNFRISIAGAQEKTALLRVGDQWCRPRGATPTTHILKLPLGLVGGRRLDLSHSVFNEWLCARLLAELGLPVARTDIATFGAQEVLVVERFDRQWATRGDDGAPWIARLPQEDLCQVHGLPSSRKYEADRGPGMRECLRVLLASEAPQADITHFLCAQLAFWLLAATDGHAKNFSVFLLPGGAYRLTPLYDVISLWPVVGRGPNQVAWPAAKLAMAVRSRNVHYALQTIQPRHWRGLAEKAGVAGVWGAMQAMVERVEPAIATLEGQLPQGFPKQTAGKVFEGMRSQLRTWRDGPDAT